MPLVYVDPVLVEEDGFDRAFGVGIFVGGVNAVGDMVCGGCAVEYFVAGFGEFHVGCLV